MRKTKNIVGMSSGGLDHMLGDCFDSIWGTPF